MKRPRKLPLREGGHIFCGNALRLNWFEVCPSPKKTIQKEKIFDLARVEKVHAPEEVVDDEAETDVVGNPPYAGSVYQTPEQRGYEAGICIPRTSYKDLDYVATFYLKAADFNSQTNSASAFVSTNSICQGEQVAMLCPTIFALGIEIGFAHQSFKWRNNAAKNAAVICIVVGLRKVCRSPKRLYGKSLSKIVQNIGPYLLEMSNIVVTKRTAPISALPRMVKGNQPSDNGNLIVSPSERNSLITRHPEASRFLRRLYGSQEFIKGIERWCLWLEDRDLPEAMTISEIATRIAAVKKFRTTAQSQQSRDNVDTPFRFAYAPHQDVEAIIVSRVASERRSYIPVGFLPPDVIISDNAYAIYNISAHLLSILSARLHAIWALTVGGRMKTDYRYSNTLVYNTFPISPLDDDHIGHLEENAWAIIAERERHVGKTMAWLYDPETMPSGLLDAHRALDDTLEKIYIGRPFKNDTERLEHLFKLYAEMTSESRMEVAFA